MARLPIWGMPLAWCRLGDNLAFPISVSNPLLLGVVVILIVAGVVAIGMFKASPAPDLPILPDKSVSDKNGFVKAPELRGLSDYINAEKSLTLESLRGKVVIVDFWTYSCINCIRTLPYLNDWHEKYSDKGLVIIGVHSPEFEFEKDFENVKKAVEKYAINYPVVLDNDFSTWRAYNNRYWPHKFLVDADGYIRYDHIGEGGYDETEQQIVKLLQERDASVQMDNSQPAADSPDFSKIKTSEVYLGFDFARQPLGNPEGFVPNQTVSYSFPASFESNLAYLDGEWENKGGFVKLVSQTGKVALRFSAQKANIVAGGLQESKLTIKLDSQLVAQINTGSDVVFENGVAIVNVNDQKLYNLVSTIDYSEKLLELDVNGPGFELYTFTFG